MLLISSHNYHTELSSSKMHTQAATIDETVLYADDNVKVTALKLDYPKEDEAQLHLSIENMYAIEDTFVEAVKSGQWQTYYNYEIHQSMFETLMNQDGLKIDSAVTNSIQSH